MPTIHVVSDDDDQLFSFFFLSCSKKKEKKNWAVSIFLFGASSILNRQRRSNDGQIHTQHKNRIVAMSTGHVSVTACRGAWTTFHRTKKKKEKWEEVSGIYDDL